MGWNIIWYVALWVWIVFHYTIPSVISGYHNLKMCFSHFTFALFISPSAYLFYGTIFALVLMPLGWLLVIPNFFVNAPDNDFYKKRYLWTGLTIIGILVIVYLLPLILWGAFPIDVGKDHYIYIRMIPFFPWPERPFLN